MTGLGKNRRRAWVLGLGLGLGLVTFLGAPAASLAEAGRIEPWALVRMPIGDDTGIRRGEVAATQVDTNNRVKGSGTFRGDLERRVFLQAREMLPRARVLRPKIAVDVTVAEEGDIPVAGDFRMGPGPNGLVRYYFVVDRQGSVLGLVDEGGAWVERVRYDVWGTPVFEAADVMAPEVSTVGTDPGTGDVVIVMSEPVVPRAVMPTAPNQNVALEAIDLSSEVYFEDALGQEVPGQVTVDLDAVDNAGVPVGSVLRWTPLAAVAVGAVLTMRVAEGAVVDDAGLRNAVVAQSVTYGPALSYSGPAPGSTQAGLQSGSLVGNRLLFQSHFWDGDVGLYHMRARMFDPRSGTFLSRDPSGYVDSVNLYAPMRWDVVNHRDPTGQATLEEQAEQFLSCIEALTGPVETTTAYCIKAVYGSFGAFAAATGSGRALAETNPIKNALVATAVSGVSAASGGAGSVVQGALGGLGGVLAGGAVSGGLTGVGTLLVSDLFGEEFSSVEDYTEVLIDSAVVGVVVSGVVYTVVGGLGLGVALEKQIRAASVDGRLQLRGLDGRIMTPRASRAGMVAFGGRRGSIPAKIQNGPAFGGLKDHARRHSDLHPNAYYNEAVRHTRTGTKFTFRHGGQTKVAFVTRTGADTFVLTSASSSGKRIFTHLEVDMQYLRNLGITLPKGF